LACTNAQVKPRYVKYKGKDALGFVLRANLIRRHLTTSQRAMVAAGVANMKQGNSRDMVDEKGAPAPFISQADAAEMMNVSRESVKRANRVIKSGGEDAYQVTVAAELANLSAGEQPMPDAGPPPGGPKSYVRGKPPQDGKASFDGGRLVPGGVTSKAAATALGVSPRSVERARTDTTAAKKLSTVAMAYIMLSEYAWSGNVSRIDAQTVRRHNSRQPFHITVTSEDIGQECYFELP
jgi:hypothetical protein